MLISVTTHFLTCYHHTCATLLVCKYLDTMQTFSAINNMLTASMIYMLLYSLNLLKYFLVIMGQRLVYK